MSRPRKQCPICKTELSNFLPLPQGYYEWMNAVGSPYPLDEFETLNCGQYQCPACGASDRERLIALYLSSRLREPLGPETSVLEIAPSRAMTAFFANHRVRYRSADLSSPLAQDHVDITDMAIYPAASFDLVICSHVLEHVPDDAQALRELRRIITPDGHLVLLVPIPLLLATTDEDLAVTDVNERWRRFGQNDHIRMYSKSDFLDRLRRQELLVEEIGIQHFGEESFRRNGIATSSVLYVCAPETIAL